jgi:hypothetical protein
VRYGFERIAWHEDTYSLVAEGISNKRLVPWKSEVMTTAEEV